MTGQGALAAITRSREFMCAFLRVESAMDFPLLCVSRGSIPR